MASEIAKLEQRILRLEKAVFGSSRNAPARSAPDERNFKGATGGIRFLISKGLFKKKHDLAALRSALAENGYHYSRQAVHEALNNLASKGGPLVSLKEGGHKVYVERK